MIDRGRFGCSLFPCGRSPRSTRRGWLGLACAFLVAPLVRAQVPIEGNEGLRNRALALSKQGNQAAALPLLEKVAAADPTDIAVLESLGGALLKEGRIEEAKARFMDAVVADPYQQSAWAGLKQWAKAAHATFEQPKIGPAASTEVEKDGKSNFGFDPKSLNRKNGDQAWLEYAKTRTLWVTEKFKLEFPGEVAYRHSLAEEVDALQNVAESVMVVKNKKKHENIDPALITLVELRDQGLLAPYVLFARADDGIAKDYAAYRDAHEDKLRLYLSNWVISTPPSQQ